MKNFFTRTTLLLLIATDIILGLWLINANFPSSGGITATLVPGIDQPMLSRLGPDPRIKLGPEYQAILASPVYFDLRSLPWLSYARIQIVYKENGQRLEGMAGQGPGEWNYAVTKPIALEDAGDGWQQATFDFNLATVVATKNMRRFLISIQPLGTSGAGEVDIKSLTVTVSR